MIPKRFLLVAGTFLLALLLYVDRICISTAKGPIAHDLQLSDKQFGWVLSAFALGYALFQTPTGMLADQFGPRRILSAVVVLWSAFTGLSSAVKNFASLLVVRFLFGAGEAGAFPGIARAVFSWIPMSERGVVTGINFSGGRLGAAFALPAVAWMVERFGWRQTFAILMCVGFAWAAYWYVWFRDDPTEHKGISPREREYILAHRQRAKLERSAGALTRSGDQAHTTLPLTGVIGDGETAAAEDSRPPKLTASLLFRSRNLWWAMAQYFCSNFTFFFCLTWLFPHLKQTYNLEAVEAGWYAAAPLVGGALGNIFAGWLMDRIYRSGRWKLSRQAPAMIGFALAAGGLVGSVQTHTAVEMIVWLTVAIFGADMTLAPSWSFCIDIGRQNSGAVSGTMNMAGNIGSFVTSLAFPYLLDWTGNPNMFFYVGAALNVIAVCVWLLVQPERRIEEY